MRRFLVTALLVAFLAPTALAKEMTAEDIIDKMVAGIDMENMVMKLEMVLTNKKGQTRKRLLNNRTIQVNGLTRSFVSFIEPADVRGTKFLVLENKGRDDDQLLYLPALKKVRRIASSQRSGSFMGTDFSYYDLTSHDVADGTHKRLEDQKLDGIDCYVAESIPKDPGESKYSKLNYWVRKDNMVVAKAEFFDLKGKLLKVLVTKDHETYEKDRWLARKLIMKNVQKGTSTLIHIAKYQFGVKLNKDYFSERFLKDESQL